MRVYDTSGPYTDSNVTIDIAAGLPELRRDWIIARGDVEEVTQREVRPEDNGQLGPDRSGGVSPFPGDLGALSPGAGRWPSGLAECSWPAWDFSLASFVSSSPISFANCDRGFMITRSPFCSQ